jgi:hypothetical protein
MDRGICIETISGRKFDITETEKFENQSWWSMRPSMIMMPATSWAKLKVWIIAQCKKTGACDKEIASWNRTIESVDETLGAME